KTANGVVYRTVRAIGRVVLRLVMAREHEDLRKVMAGSWYGKDTFWRTILDLNKISWYADKEGRMRETCQRRCLSIVDGIYSGEGDGPLRPTTRHDGILLAGVNPVLVDLLACFVMGIDPDAVPQVRRAFEIKRYPLVSATYDSWRARFPAIVRSNVSPVPNLHYHLPPGWEGHVPRLEPAAAQREPELR